MKLKGLYTLLYFYVSVTSAAVITHRINRNVTTVKDMNLGIPASKELQASFSSIQNIDALASDFIKSLPSVPTSVTTFVVASYISYIAIGMAFPWVLTALNLPVLNDFSAKSRNSRSISLVDTLSVQFAKDLASRSQTVEEILTSGSNVISLGVSAVRMTTRSIHDKVDYVRGTVENFMEALKPGCLSRYMCRAGQSTGSAYPNVGILLRSLDSDHLDEFSQALIDGTTIGDCDSVFHECDL